MVAINATISEICPPESTRARTSRPATSVPIGCCQENCPAADRNGGNAFVSEASRGMKSYGCPVAFSITVGPIKHASAMIMTTPPPTAASPQLVRDILSRVSRQPRICASRRRRARIRRGSAYVCEQMVSSCPLSGSKLCFATSRKVKRTDDRESCLHARAVLACVPVCGSA